MDIILDISEREDEQPCNEETETNPIYYCIKFRTLEEFTNYCKKYLRTVEEGVNIPDNLLAKVLDEWREFLK